MKNKFHFLKKIYALCVLLFVYNIHAQSQKPLALIKNQFNNYKSNTVQEKLFVHTDKKFYQAGEIMWFKIYCVDAGFHKPLSLSKVAYVELIDKHNRSILQAKIAIDSGSGKGSLYMPVHINSGNYTLRAYTNWMKNFDVDYFFKKNITVINSQKNADLPVKDSIITTYDVQFFPEGGNLVNGLQSKIGFKVTNQFGKGVSCKGKIINENGDSVTAVNSLQFGMGSFMLQPVENHSYKAVLTFETGKSTTKNIPAAYANGYVINVDNKNEDVINVWVNATGVTTQNVFLMAQTRGSIKFTASATLQNNAASFVIEKNKLGEGISQITIFNDNAQPVCERLCFIFPKDNNNAQISINKEKYITREKVSVDVQQPITNQIANLSIAVYKIDSLQQYDEINIANYLLLSSDLKGRIESPGYYFSETNNNAGEAMDNLMLTQGWRRFKWENILQEKTTVLTYEPECKTHIINGKVIDTRTDKPASHIACYASVPGTRSIFASNLSDDNGNVKFEIKNMFGSSELIMQTNSFRDSTYRIDIANPFVEKFSPDPIAPFLLPVKNPNTLLDQSISVQVQNIYSGTKLKQFTEAGTDTSFFYYKPDLSYLLDNYTRFTTMEEVLREYVQLVNVRRRGGKYHLTVFNTDVQKLMDEDPLVLLDGVPVFDIDKLIAYDPLKVRQLDVLTRRYYIGNAGYDGLLNLVTYKGDFPGYELDSKATVLDYESLQLQREFYSPSYETENQAASHFPDFRNVLYWNADVKFINIQNNKLTFFTSDKKGKYIIVLQGINESGKCISALKYFEVE